MLTLSEPEVVSEELAVEAPAVAAPPTISVVADPAPRSHPWRSTPALLGVSVLFWLCAMAADAMGAPPPVAPGLAITGFTIFVLTALVASYRSIVGIITLAREIYTGTAEGAGISILSILGNLVIAAYGLLVAYMSAFGFSRGRQLRRFGRVLLPDLRPSSEWATPAMGLSPEGAPAGLANQWRENGKTEHASVAAFARLTLDLMALGAPPALIAGANRDALDEIRHTELCFAIARSLDGRTVSPGPFPQAQRVSTLPRSRTLALAKLAVDSLVDGALHEGVSARIIAKLAQRCDVPAIRAALKEIAADEGRHAAHGWAVVAWCLDEGGRPVAHALLGALQGLPSQMRSELPLAAANGEWLRWGIHDHALEAQEYAAALTQVTARVRTRVSAVSRAA